MTKERDDFSRNNGCYSHPFYLFVGISGLIIGTAKSEGKADRKLESDGYLKNALLMFESGLVVTLSIFLILSVMINAILI